MRSDAAGNLSCPALKSYAAQPSRAGLSPRNGRTVENNDKTNGLQFWHIPVSKGQTSESC